MLHHIITSIKFVGTDEKMLSKSNFIFGSSVDPQDALDVEATLWYYDGEGVVYTLFITECYYPLL